jgi:hypothetical protein
MFIVLFHIGILARLRVGRRAGYKKIPSVREKQLIIMATLERYNQSR